MDKRVADTYTANTNATNKTSLYDSYIKAFRWASDRLPREDGGIVAFISNGAWIDGYAQSGMRKCLENEFTSIYVFNLRGNARTQGELRRKEKDNVFGQGTRTTITITFLVKNPAKTGKAVIHYHDVGDYLTQKEKLNIVRDFKSVRNIDWDIIEPTEKHDWINQRDGLFDSLIELGNKNEKNNVFFSIFSAGDITNRDTWVYGSSQFALAERIKDMIVFYNHERVKCVCCNSINEVMDIVSVDESKIKWDQKLYEHALKGINEVFEVSNIRRALYRPFFKQWLYYDKSFNWSQYQLPKIFPTESSENMLMCVSGTGGTKDFTCVMTDVTLDRQTNFNCQCFPLYWYEPNKNRQRTLFDGANENDAYIRRDGITDWILKEVRRRFGNAHNITKEMIFYYVYGILHSRDYRERFADDLKKSLPRIPIVDKVEDFTAFSDFGRKLAELHLKYETVAPYPGVVVKGDRPADPDNPDDYAYFRVEKLKPNDDKTTIYYNHNITIENIPEEAYRYVVNGKSAIDWIIERYCVSQDKKTLIVNDANDWAKEHHKPRYILDLLLSVINVSVQTVEIMGALPKLSFPVSEGGDATT